MDGAVRRLIETDEFPIGVISQHSRRDQNVRKGHLHTLHVWWATRPLAACRAVLLGTILPDPVDERCPQTFRQGAREALSWYSSRDLSDPMALRQALLKFIGEFADWDASGKARWVETARALVQRTARPPRLLRQGPIQAGPHSDPERPGSPGCAWRTTSGGPLRAGSA